MKQLTLSELAKLTQSDLVGNPDHIIKGVADLENASAEDVCFFANPRYEKAMQASSAGAVFISPNVRLSEKRNFLINGNPSHAFQQTLEYFRSTQEVTGFLGIHPTAVIHPSCKLGERVNVGPYAVLDKNVSVDSDTFIGAGCYLGPEVRVGTHCLIHPHVVVRERCVIGNHVIIQPGAVIGSCGFGYLTDKQGTHTKLNQIGNVAVEDNVEIGANTTIDRARFKTTLIGKGSKIDNLVQIAHGVCLGENNILAAQTGIAGSTSTGRCVMAGGQVAIAGHLKIGDGVMLAGRAGVSKSLPHAGKYNGAPAYPLDEYNRNSVLLRNIESYIERIKALEERDKQDRINIKEKTGCAGSPSAAG